MKNNFINIIIFFITFLSLLTHILADEFIFDVTEIQIYEKGNLIKGINGGTVTTKNDIVITADNFEYNKLTTLLKAVGNAKLVDRNQNIIIEAPEVYYLKNKEEIYTLGKSKANEGLYIEINADDYFRYNKLTSILEAKGNVVITDIEKDVIIESNQIFYEKIKNKFFTIGKTRAYVEKKYTINTSNLVFLKDKMLISSIKKTILNDDLSNFYKLEEFEYQVDKEILKGKKINASLIVDNPENASGVNKGDQYFFEEGFFDLKNNKFLAKNVEIKFQKDMYDNTENDPRLKGVYAIGDEFNTNLEKAIFTTCKNNDKCPPWVIESKKVKHDKVKKQIIYNDAYLKIYDIPVVYFPKFFHPDPSVKRQSGFLRPGYSSSKTLGSFVTTQCFYLISDNKDMTIKPRVYDDDKLILQAEYRQKNKKMLTIADFSFTKGHNSSLTDKKDSRTHFFSKTVIDLDLDKFLKSKLNIEYQKTSNDNYLKLFALESPLLEGSLDVLESNVTLDLEEEGYDLSASAKRYETLSGTNNDRYQYVLPTYNFSKNFDVEQISGSFNFNSYGNNTLNNTNVSSSIISNDLTFESIDYYSEAGFKNDFGVMIKNLNTIGKNNANYKPSPQSELISTYRYNISYPLTKETSKSLNTLDPKISLKFSPHEMKNHNSLGRRINIDNIYNFNRLSMFDSFEGGESLTVGFDFKKEKIIKKNQIKEIKDYFEFKLATVIRNKEVKNIPLNSTIGKKRSNIFGAAKYTITDKLSLDYNFSATKDLSIMEYNSLDALFNFKNFSTQIKFIEERGNLGDTNIIENVSKYNFDSSNSIEFKTRKNKKINLTEYYDLIYQYENDCLIAGIRYKKKYYTDADIRPSEELFFSITIVPFATFSPDELDLSNLRNRDK